MSRGPGKAEDIQYVVLAEMLGRVQAAISLRRIICRALNTTERRTVDQEIKRLVRDAKHYCDEIGAVWANWRATMLWHYLRETRADEPKNGGAA